MGGSVFGGFVAAAFVSQLCQHVLFRSRRLSALFPNHRLGLSVLLISLFGYGFCECSGRLYMLHYCLHRTCAALLLVL